MKWPASGRKYLESFVLPSIGAKRFAVPLKRFPQAFTRNFRFMKIDSGSFVNASATRAFVLSKT
jgi:hypothetical protein